MRPGASAPTSTNKGNSMTLPNLHRSPAVRGTALLAGVLVAALQLPARADDGDDDAYDIGLWGDLPYSVQQETVGLPRLLADMNAHHLKFTVHDGDLKQGSGSL